MKVTQVTCCIVQQILSFLKFLCVQIWSALWRSEVNVQYFPRFIHLLIYVCMYFEAASLSKPRTQPLAGQAAHQVPGIVLSPPPPRFCAVLYLPTWHFTN